MRLVTFEAADQPPQAGVLTADGGGVVPAAAALAAAGARPDARPQAMLDLLTAWDDVEAALRDAVDEPPVDPVPRDAARLHAPIPRPPTVRDFYAFEEHVARSWKRRGAHVPEAWYDVPVFYFTNPLAVKAPGDAVAPPRGSRALDYELEVAWTVKRPLRDPTAEEAAEAILGLTIMNDWSARDIQKHEMSVGLGPAKGKDFATTLGPSLVTLDELADRAGDTAYDLRMEALVNGERLSDGNLDSLHYGLGEMTAHAARDVTVHPGEVMGTGTVGTGSLLDLGRSPGDYLEPGDEVTLRVERLGEITTPIVNPDERRNQSQR